MALSKQIVLAAAAWLALASATSFRTMYTAPDSVNAVYTAPDSAGDMATATSATILSAATTLLAASTAAMLSSITPAPNVLEPRREHWTTAYITKITKHKGFWLFQGPVYTTETKTIMPSGRFAGTCRLVDNYCTYKWDFDQVKSRPCHHEACPFEAAPCVADWKGMVRKSKTKTWCNIPLHPELGLNLSNPDIISPESYASLLWAQQKSTTKLVEHVTPTVAIGAPITIDGGNDAAVAPVESEAAVSAEVAAHNDGAVVKVYTVAISEA